MFQWKNCWRHVSLSAAVLKNFKSSVWHRVKVLGDINFIIEILESRDIRTYYKRRWVPEALFLLAMLDYISREKDGFAVKV